MSASEYNNSEFRTPNSELKKCAVSSVGRAVKIPSCIKTVTAILAFNTQAAGSIPARRTTAERAGAVHAAARKLAYGKSIKF